MCLGLFCSFGVTEESDRAYSEGCLGRVESMFNDNLLGSSVKFRDPEGLKGTSTCQQPNS